MKLPLRYIVTYTAIILGGAVFFIVSLFANTDSILLPQCIFRQITGVSCPSCGLTTSIILIMHGEITAGLKAHPAGLPVIFMAAFLMLISAYALIRRSRLERLFGRTTAKAAVIIAAAYLLLWIARLAKAISK